jgi:hypothetical protein
MIWLMMRRVNTFLKRKQDSHERKRHLPNCKECLIDLVLHEAYWTAGLIEIWVYILRPSHPVRSRRQCIYPLTPIKFDNPAWLPADEETSSSVQSPKHTGYVRIIMPFNTFGLPLLKTLSTSGQTKFFYTIPDRGLAQDGLKRLARCGVRGNLSNSRNCPHNNFSISVPLGSFWLKIVRWMLLQFRSTESCHDLYMFHHLRKSPRCIVKQSLDFPRPTPDSGN